MLPTNRFFILHLLYADLDSFLPDAFFEEDVDLARARRLAQLAQRLGFDLADAFTGEGKRLPHLRESVLGTVLQPKPHLDDPLLTWGECLQHERRLLLQ